MLSLVMWAIIGVCLLFACATDIVYCRVYNFVWWIAGMAALVLWQLRGVWPNKGQLIGFIVYVLLQQFLFSKMYGKADCHAFCVCALVGLTMGWGLYEFLVQMFFAFVSLTLVQFVFGNVNSTGNLKKPVPFLPYITLAFLSVLWYHNIC